MSDNAELLMRDKANIVREIKNFRNDQKSVLKRYEIFETVCRKLNFHLDKFFLADISDIYLYSCQIMINGRCFTQAAGTTQEDAYHNAIILNLNPADQHDVTLADEIRENVSDCELRDEFILFCKAYFRKMYILSKINKINYETLKAQLKTNAPLDMSLSEQYRKINSSQTICSIFLNGRLLLQQAVGVDDNDSLECAARDFFGAYSIGPTAKTILQSSKNVLNEQKLLAQLYNHLKQTSNISNYFQIIKEFVEKLDYKMKVKIDEEGVATVEINGVTIAEAKSTDKYCSYIECCKDLIEKINQTKGNIPNEERRQFFTTNSASCNASPQHLSGENLKKKFKEIAKKAEEERKSNENKSHWSIINRLFLKENLKIEPNYKSDLGTTECSLMYRNDDIGTGWGNNKESSREIAAREFIKAYSYK